MILHKSLPKIFTTIIIWIFFLSIVFPISNKDQIIFFQVSPESTKIFFISCCSFFLVIMPLLAFRNENYLNEIVDSGGCSPTTYWETIIITSPFLIVFFFMMAAYWPGVITTDSIGIWNGVIAGQSTALSGILHIIVVRIIYVLGGPPQFVIIFQAAILYLTLILCIRELSCWNISKKTLIFTTIIISAFPATAMITIAFWKDILYVSGILLCFTSNLTWIRNSTKPAKCLSSKFSFITGLLIIMSSRLNGIIMAIVVPGILALFFKRSNRKFLIHVSFAMICSFIAIYKLAAPSIGISPVPTVFQSVIPMHIMGAMISKGAVILPAEKAIAEEFLPDDIWKSHYLCGNVNALFYSKRRSTQAQENRSLDLWKVAIFISARNPSIFLDHELCLTSYLWRLSPLTEAGLNVPPGENELGGEIPPVQFRTQPIISNAHDFLEKIRALTLYPLLSTFFWQPALYFYACLLIPLIFYLNTKNYIFLSLTTMPLLNTLILIPLAATNETRYQYPVMIIFFLLFSLCFTNSQESQPRQNAKLIKKNYAKQITAKSTQGSSD